MLPRHKWGTFGIHLILNAHMCVPIIQQEVHTSTGLVGGHCLPSLGGSPIVWKLPTVFKYKIGQEGNAAHIHRSFIHFWLFMTINEHFHFTQRRLLHGHDIVFDQSYAKLLLHDHRACFPLIFTRREDKKYWIWIDRLYLKGMCLGYVYMQVWYIVKAHPDSWLLSKIFS